MPLDDVLLGTRLIWGLPSFLRRILTLEEAQAALRDRLTRREADFLALLRRAVYQHAPSPYGRLLRHAGCEYGDVEHLVGQEGVEGALRVLLRCGLYLTVDELKGRKPVVRGGREL